jgi:hypothetical protein
MVELSHHHEIQKRYSSNLNVSCSSRGSRYHHFAVCICYIVLSQSIPLEQTGIEDILPPTKLNKALVHRLEPESRAHQLSIPELDIQVSCNNCSLYTSLFTFYYFECPKIFSVLEFSFSEIQQT